MGAATRRKTTPKPQTTEGTKATVARPRKVGARIDTSKELEPPRTQCSSSLRLPPQRQGHRGPKPHPKLLPVPRGRNPALLPQLSPLIPLVSQDHQDGRHLRQRQTLPFHQELGSKESTTASTVTATMDLARAGAVLQTGVGGHSGLPSRWEEASISLRCKRK